MTRTNIAAIETIETAERENPVCSCGQHTAAVAKNDGIWLECLSIRDADCGPLGRLLAPFQEAGHVRMLIVEPLDYAA
jgi:hypothetical protein